MRPIRLELAAFGPYPGHEVVDFDALADLGMFVVSGPTGAGKTTIFDAMCFALYGDLPGTRSGEGAQVRVRSDLAEPGTLTYATFEFEARGERWRVHRVPKQMRPRLRGTGDPVQQDHEATLFRWSGTDWEPQETQPRKVNPRCVALVGLSAAQFQQVVLLPQGRFQEFLDAKTDVRKALLEHLFRTGRYAAIEQEISRRAQAADAAAKEFTDRTDRTLGDVERSLGELRDLLIAATPEDVPEAAPGANGVDADESGDTGEAGEAAGADAVSSPPRSAADRVAAAAVELEALVEGPVRAGDDRAESARLAAVARRDELEAARGVAEQMESLGRLAAEVARLDAESHIRAAESERIEAARAAVVLLDPLNRHADARGALPEAEAARDVARAAAVERLQALGRATPPQGADGEELVAAISAVTAESARHTAAAGRLADAAADRARAAEARRQAEQAEALVTASDAQVTALGEQRAQVEAELGAARATASSTEVLRSRLNAATARSGRADKLAIARARAEQLKAKLADQREEHARLTGERAELEQRRRDTEPLAGRLEQAALAVTEAAARRTDLQRLRTAQEEMARSETVLVERRGAFERTLEGFVSAAAPRLAAQLQPDHPCPVCGSAEHPNPATPEDDRGAVDLDAVEAAQVALDTAQRAVEATRGRVASFAHVADASEAALDSALADAQAAGQEAAAAAAALPGLLLDLEGRDARLAGLRATIEERDGERQRLEGEAATLAADLTADLGEDAERPVEWFREQSTELERRWRAAADAASLAERLERRATDLGRQQEEARSQAEQARLAATAHTTAAATADEAATRTEEDVRAEFGDGDLTVIATGLTRAAEALSRWRATVNALDAARTELASAREALDRKLADGGWADEAAVRAAAVEPAELRRLDEAHRAWATALATARSKLADLEALDLPGTPPDLVALTEAHDAATAAAAAALTVQAQAAERVRVVREGIEDASGLIREGGAVIALRDRWHRLEQVCCKATNPIGAGLHTWVLAAHLNIVLEAANAHLQIMTDGRYRIVLGEGGMHRTRNVALDVVLEDALSGATRVPQQMSGGERFQVALSLAMGLADVVSNQGDGAPIEALFVDEGFGTLDRDAQQHAMDVLRTLPDRNLLVGVITHVESVKEALGVGIEVVRRPGGGSTIVTRAERDAAEVPA